MSSPAGWKNPIRVLSGQVQGNVDPTALLPSRTDLLRGRLEFQRWLLRTRRKRFTPIQVTLQGVIFDGHHAVRAAAEEGISVDVVVIDQPVASSGQTILSLPVR
jgi:hypothetical protein